MKVKVKIVGTSSLLMHRFSGVKKDTKKDVQYTVEGDMADGLYQDENGCYAPSTWIEATLREAAKNFKKGKGNQKTTILSSVFVEEEKIPLKEKYEPYTTAVVVQRNRILKSRPKFDNWSLEFTLNFDSERIDSSMLKNILVEAGAIKGIGTWRPKFGRFKVEKFDVVK